MYNTLEPKITPEKQESATERALREAKSYLNQTSRSINDGGAITCLSLALEKIIKAIELDRNERAKQIRSGGLIK